VFVAGGFFTLVGALALLRGATSVRARVVLVLLLGAGVVEVLLGAGVLAAVELVVCVETLGLDACAERDSSWCAFCCEAPTAPWAFAIARVRPFTPGAAPW
jgi:hypothetical protein